MLPFVSSGEKKNLMVYLKQIRLHCFIYGLQEFSAAILMSISARWQHVFPQCIRCSLTRDFMVKSTAWQMNDVEF